MKDELIQERVSFAGPRGLLHGELTYAADEPPALACLLLNPHPYMGGQMGNNLIEALAGRLPGGGVVTLRFDYSGVGRSEGPTIDVAQAMSVFWQMSVAPQDPWMIEDAISARRWLMAQSGCAVLPIGYSFGAHVAARMVADGLFGLIVICPTLTQHDLSNAAQCSLPKLVIYSDDDFATPRAVTEAWIEWLSPPKRAVCIRGAQHFFRGIESPVVQACRAFIHEFSPQFAVRERLPC